MDTSSTDIYIALLIAIIFAAALKMPVFVEVISRDLRSVLLFAKIKKLMAKHKQSNASLVSLFDKQADASPDHVLLINAERNLSWTSAEVQLMSCKIASILHTFYGLKSGDEIALLMSNRPEFACVLLGAARLGVVVAPIYVGLKAGQIKSALQVCTQMKALVFEAALDSAVGQLKSDSELDMQFIAFESDLMSKLTCIQNATIIDLLRDLKLPSFDDNLLYIFTSGTTGPPKAAKITHAKAILRASAHFLPQVACRLQRIYICIPFAHSLAGCGGLGLALVYGHTLIIRSAFSLASFWPDVVHFNASMALYVGEMLRYLVSDSSCDPPAKHSLEILLGVGATPSVCSSFRARFGVVNIIESYASSEANTQLINLNCKPGAVGFIPFPWLPKRLLVKFYPNAIIKVSDVLSGHPLRDSSTGLCVFAAPNEVGLFIGRIQATDVLLSFDGYVDDKASESKIIHNVFKAGDAYFNSGDLLVADAHGYVKFVSRVGDNCRWKAHNFAAAEVEAVLHSCACVARALVYGVHIAGCEGLAAMAALVLNADAVPSFEPNKELLPALRSGLPAFALPMFLRLIDASDVQMTATHKVIKTVLMKEGYQLNGKASERRIYYFDIRDKKYKLLTTSTFSQIMDGQIAF